MSLDARKHPGQQLTILEKPPNEFLAWFAGYLEADGHVYVGTYKGRKVHNLGASQSKKHGLRQLEHIRDMFGGVGTVYTTRKEDTKPILNKMGDGTVKEYYSNGDMHTWQLTDSKAIKHILQWVQPYLDANTKLSDQLEYFEVDEHIPVWEQRKWIDVDNVESKFTTGYTNACKLHNALYNRVTSIKADIDKSNELSRLKREYERSYTGEISFDEFISVATPALRKAVSEHPIEGYEPPDCNDYSIHSISCENNSLEIRIDGSMKAGYILHNTKKHIEKVLNLNISVKWV